MILRIVWSRDADEDLLSIWTYLDAEWSSTAADAEIRKIVRVSERLRKWPYSGRSRDNIVAGMRSLVATPYVIYYRLAEGEVQVIRVLHGRRDIEAIFADKS